MLSQLCNKSMSSRIPTKQAAQGPARIKTTPKKYFRVTILFSYELQLLCVCYYRSLPEIVYLKCYREFIFFQFTYNFTLFFILFLFNSLILGVIKIGGPCFVLSRNSAAHLDHFQSDKWDSCIENRDVEPFSLYPFRGKYKTWTTGPWTPYFYYP